jgi:zinc transporter ZupT
LLAAVCFFSGILIGNLLDLFVHWLENKDAGTGGNAECTGHDMDGMFEGIEALKSNPAITNGDGDSELKPVNLAPVLSGDDDVEGQTEPATARAVPAIPGGPALSSSPLPHAGLASSTVPMKGGEGLEEQQQLTETEKSRALVKMGRLTALAIAIHNFPEGLATFVGTVDDPTVGLSLAIAIGIHNIPEGLCVSIPIYYATKDRCLAFKWAFLSGISEPIGAGLGWIVLANAMDMRMYGVIFGVVAGLMVNICIHELLPTAQKYDPHDKVTSKSVIAGMFVMALSLVMFQV